ncbi:MAG TPA: hypothetical protein VN034_06245 [Sphingopyxis sp.]|nr:hypothetical protein [Sphingopyxis sp.]
MATFVAIVATAVASAATIIASSALKIIVTGSAGSVIRKAAASTMKPPPRVPYNIRVSTQYLNALALGIYNLSIKNQKIFTASALFSYVSENCVKELDALNAKHLLLYAPKDSLKGDIRVSYLLDKPVNDVLIAARYQLSARAGRVVTNLEMHRLAISIVAGQ